MAADDRKDVLESEEGQKYVKRSKDALDKIATEMARIEKLEKQQENLQKA